MDDPFDLARFRDAQAPVYAAALAELTQGRKRTHWMWFVFPQLAVLGRSAMAKRYGISGLGEAQAYLDDAVLGARLDECTQAVLGHAGTAPEAIFGPVDAMKLRSSMTLFDLAGGGPDFGQVLQIFHGGAQCPLTVSAMA